MLVDEPVDPVGVGLEEPGQKLLVDVIAFGLPKELLVGLLPVVGLACLLMELGIVDGETGGKPGRAADLVVFLQNDHLGPQILGLGGGSHARRAGADDADIALEADGVVGLGLGFGNIRAGDGAVMAHALAGAAGQALLRIDPILVVSEGDSPGGTFHAAAVAAGAVLLINDIGHSSYLLKVLHCQLIEKQAVCPIHNPHKCMHALCSGA